MELKLRSRTGVGVVFVEIEGSLDHRGSPAFESALRPLLEGAEPRLLLDFSGVDYISSAGIRVLLSAMKVVRAKGGEFRYVGVWRSVKEIFDIAGLSQHIAIFADRAPALANFGLDVTERNERGLQILRLDGPLDKSASAILKKWLDGLRQESGGPILIDLSGVHYAAVECLRILQAASAASGEGGRALVLLAPRETVREAIEVCGLERDLRLAQTVEDALPLLKKEELDL